MRLDSYLAILYSEFSRSQLKQFIEAGSVTVNGQIVTKPSCDVNFGDSVKFNRPDANNYDLTKEVANLQSNIIFENDNVIVINKPAGMLVHAKGGIVPEFTLADLVRSKFDKNELVENSNNNRLGIVHRLDRATSGVIICAKNISTAKLLAKQFADRKTKKEYLAICNHTPKDNIGRINLPIGRNFNRPSTFKVDPKGKPAITDYAVLNHYGQGKCLIELHPITGRTHQLRVHLSYIGCPIAGDPVYGDGKYGDRLMLHAHKLEITVPDNSGVMQRKTFTADAPLEFNLNNTDTL